MVIARSLTRRERRDLGVTGLNVIRVLREAIKSGEVERTTPAEEVSLIVLQQLMVEKPAQWQALAANPSIDWDAIMRFLERLIEILLMILPLFL